MTTEKKTFIDRILAHAGHPAYSWVVFVMTVCESTFLFIPPEVFMTPAIIADKRRAFPITVAASVGSLVGGALAYVIGMCLFDSVGVWLIENFASAEKFELARTLFLRHGILIVILTAITPIPYKLIGICAGFLGFPLWLFLAVSALFRTTRFVLVGFLLWRFQERANAIVKKYFWYLVLLAFLGAALGLGLLMMV